MKLIKNRDLFLDFLELNRNSTIHSTSAKSAFDDYRVAVNNPTLVNLWFIYSLIVFFPVLHKCTRFTYVFESWWFKVLANLVARRMLKGPTTFNASDWHAAKMNERIFYFICRFVVLLCSLAFRFVFGWAICFFLLFSALIWFYDHLDYGYYCQLLFIIHAIRATFYVWSRNYKRHLKPRKSRTKIWLNWWIVSWFLF